MRLSLILTTAVAAVALSGCDQMPRIALVYPDKAPSCAQPAKPACPVTQATATPAVEVPAAKIPAEPVMAPEPVVRKVVARAAMHHAAQAERRERWSSETYAGGPAPAPPYDGQVVVPEPHAYARVERQETEHYAERQESYGYSSGGYASGGYGPVGPPQAVPCPCGPQLAAGRDRDGFLTWPGKLAQRP